MVPRGSCPSTNALTSWGARKASESDAFPRAMAHTRRARVDPALTYRSLPAFILAGFNT